MRPFRVGTRTLVCHLQKTQPAQLLTDVLPRPVLPLHQVEVFPSGIPQTHFQVCASHTVGEASPEASPSLTCPRKAIKKSQISSGKQEKESYSTLRRWKRDSTDWLCPGRPESESRAIPTSADPAEAWPAHRWYILAWASVSSCMGSL